MLNSLYLIALVVFFIGWLIMRYKPWGAYIAIAGATLFVLIWLIGILKLA
jgi:hypothetical protein